MSYAKYDIIIIIEVKHTHIGFYLNCDIHQEMIGQSVIADELKNSNRTQKNLALHWQSMI